MTARIARQLLIAVRSPVIVAAVWACVVVFLVLGSEMLRDPPRWINLDRERSLPTAFTVGLMLAASLAAGLVAILTPERGRAGWIWRGAPAVLALLLAFMAADDWFAWHERLQDLGGQPWTFWYWPVPATATLASAVLSTKADRRSAVYLALGFLAWLGAGVIETFFWGDGLEYQDPVTMPIEEVLEMAAPIAFFAALSRIATGHLTKAMGSKGNGGRI
jgi:hypothetical protein